MRVVDFVDLHLQASRGVTFAELTQCSRSLAYEFDGTVILSRTFNTISDLVRVSVEISSIVLLSGRFPKAEIRYTWKTQPRPTETTFVCWGEVAENLPGYIDARLDDDLSGVMGKIVSIVTSK
jgi:hypothetical protein